jgi:hypothetical protein
MEDLAQKEFNKICESYINDLIEEVIQSDFEKPSIPEVILAVITDLTHDDNNDDHDHTSDQQHFNGFNQIYNFSQDKTRSISPIVYNNNNGTNGDIDPYYTRVHQTGKIGSGLNNHDSVRSTNSSSQSIGLTSTADPTASYLQVKFILKMFWFFVTRKQILRFLDSSNTSSYYSNNTTICWTRW